MTELQGCIRFWERVLHDFQFLMEPGTLAQVHSTIRLQEKLQEVKEGE